MNTTIFAVAGATLAALTAANAAVFTVEQEANPGAGDFAILGFLNTYDQTGGTFANAYGYQRDERWSYDGDSVGLPASESGNVLSFLVETDEGIGFFTVMDQANDGNGGATDSTWTLSDDTASIVVRDDNPGNDVYSDDGTNFVMDHQWNSCCTDGFVLGSLDGQFTLVGNFSSFSNITEWYALDAGGERITLQLEEGLNIRIRPFGGDITSEVPVPAAFPLGMAGFAGFMSLARRRRRA